MKCVYCGQAEVDGVDRCPVCGKSKDNFLSKVLAFLRNSSSSADRQQSDIDAQASRDSQSGSVAAGAARQDREQRRQANEAADVNSNQSAGFSPQGSNPAREKRTSGFSQQNRADRDSGFSHNESRYSQPGSAEAPFRMTVRQVNEVPGIGWGAAGLVEGGAVLLGQQVVLTTSDGRRTELMVEGILIGNNVEEIVAPGTEATLFFTKLNEPIRPGDTLSDP